MLYKLRLHDFLVKYGWDISMCVSFSNELTPLSLFGILSILLTLHFSKFWQTLEITYYVLHIRQTLNYRFLLTEQLRKTRFQPQNKHHMNYV